jgi:hypothetical protein
MVGNKIKMKIKIIKKNDLKEISTAGAVAGFAGGVFKEEKKELEELYSTSGAYMDSGGPFERSKKGHKRYIRMRYTNQGLQNFKPNRYFVENKTEERKIRIKIRKNLEERCQKGYKTHKKRKTKKMFGKRYRNCVKAE